MQRYSPLSSSTELHGATALIVLCLTLLSGCGGGAEEPAPEAPTVSNSSPAPSTTASSSSANESSEEEESSEYGGESYSEEGAGGSSNSSGEGGMKNSGGMGMMGGMMGGMMNGEDAEEQGGMMNSGYTMGDMGGGEEESSMMGAYEGMMAGGMMAGNEGEEMGGMMGGMGGYPGAGGMMGGSGGAPNLNLVMQFVRQNCINCHGATSPKGDVSLASVSAEVASDAILWQDVVEQLESHSMPPANVERRPDPKQQEVVVNFLKEELEKAGMGDSQDFLARAKHYFGSGEEEEAIDYFYAQALTVDDEQAETLLANARWFVLGRRPVTTLRFAAGVILNAPEGQDVKPIGTPQLAGAGAGGGMGMGMGMGMEGYPSAGGPADSAKTKQPSFYQLTGDFGQALASAFESRWSAGNLGTVFNDVVAIERKPLTNAGGAGMGMESGYGGMGMESGYGGAMGMGGEGMGGYEGSGSGAAGQPAAKPRKTILPGQSITPGLVYLGTGTQKELQEKASEAGVDGLFLFEVEATVNRRTGLVNNKTRVRLTLADGTVISRTNSLTNIDVEREKLRGTDSDEVQVNIDRLFAKFDDDIKLIDMPIPQAEHARRRVQQLVNDKSVDPLVTMFETRLYHSLGALTLDEAATVYQIVLRGNEGLALATGTPDDRKLVMQKVIEQ